MINIQLSDGVQRCLSLTKRDESSLTYLEQHLEDSAFDVKLQVQMAYERIKNGEAAVGSVWKQIANRNKGE